MYGFHDGVYFNHPPVILFCIEGHLEKAYEDAWDMDLPLGECTRQRRLPVDFWITGHQGVLTIAICTYLLNVIFFTTRNQGLHTLTNSVGYVGMVDSQKVKTDHPLSTSTNQFVNTLWILVVD